MHGCRIEALHDLIHARRVGTHTPELLEALSGGHPDSARILGSSDLTSGSATSGTWGGSPQGTQQIGHHARWHGAKPTPSGLLPTTGLHLVRLGTNRHALLRTASTQLT